MISWTGEKFAGGQKVTKQTPLDIIPVYVKAGAVLPIGPKVQYALEKNWDDLEIRVYPGSANGDFTLYEDENDNYNYEKGKYSEIKFHWDDKKHNVKYFRSCTGSFEGMIGDRKFNIVVAPAAGGATEGSKAVRSVTYNGKGVSVIL